MGNERGSDALMTPEQLAEAQRQVELQQAQALEEERKTAAQPTDDPRDHGA